MISLPRVFYLPARPPFFLSLLFFGFVALSHAGNLPGRLRPKVLWAKRAFRHPIDVARYESYVLQRSQNARGAD